MPNRALVWTLAVLAVVLVVVPLLGAVGMMSVGWMGGGHMMMGMSAAGLVWTLLAAMVVRRMASHTRAASCRYRPSL